MNDQPIPRWALDEAKDLIKAQLARHPDGGVRLMNEIVELADDEPHVFRIANALVERGKNPALCSKKLSR